MERNPIDQSDHDQWRARVRTSLSAIECVPLGDRYILHSPASGAILSTDEIGLAIFSDPIAPQGKASCLPSSIINEILQSWEHAGLFEGKQRPFPDLVTDDGHPVAHHRVYGNGWGAFSVATDDPILANQLDDILWPFVTSNGAPDDAVALRCVTCTGGGLGIFRDGRALWGRASIDAARYLVVREAAETLCGIDRVGGVLHGAAVLGRGKALLIMGESGRGKSTLAQGLIDAGCGYLADDHLPCHIDGRHILAFPTGSAIKRGARDLGEVRRLMARHGDCRSSRDGVSYLPLEPAVAPGTAIPLAAIVFPEYAAGAALEISRLTSESAFSAAIASGSRRSRHNARIAPLANLFASVPAYALRYGTSAQSIPACLDLLAV